MDLRFGYEDYKQKWRTVHGIVYGAKAKVLLEDINQFLEEQPTELVLINARNIVNANEDNIRELVQMCQQIFGDKIYTPEKNWMDRTIGELVDSNNRVFLIFWDPDWTVYDEFPFVFNNNNANYFFNTYADADTYEPMVSFNREVIDEFKNLPNRTSKSKFKPKNKLSKDFGEDNLILTSWTQTPNALTIIRSLKTDSFISTWEMTQEARFAFPEFYEEMKLKYEYPIFGNVFIMDYLDELTSETILRPLIEF